MRSLQIAALATFGVGLALLVAGYTFRSDGSSAADDPLASRDIQATPTNTRAPASTPTTAVSPTPTATPFAGAVAGLRIDRFKVDSPIEEIGLTGDNQLDVPKNPHNTGWYYIYDRPGWGGNAVFSAHVDYYPNIIGPFHRLADLVIDDEVSIEMADGTLYRYRVVSTKRYEKDNIPMGDIIWPKTKPPEAEWITLITCGGQFVSAVPGGPGEYLHRDVVVAERFQ